MKSDAPAIVLVDEQPGKGKEQINESSNPACEAAC